MQGGHLELDGLGAEVVADYVLGDGQRVAPQLEYAPLPTGIQSMAQARVAALECNGSPIA